MTCLSPRSAAAADDGESSPRPLASPWPVGKLPASAEWPLVAVGIAGALLMAVPGFRYQIGVSPCASWAAVGPRIGHAAIYLLRCCC